MTFLIGTQGVMPCSYSREIYSLAWMKVGDEEVLALIDMYTYIGKRFGIGISEGTHNITDNFSLIIKNVSLQDGGLYVCVVSDVEKVMLVKNYTLVNVSGKVNLHPV